MKTPFVAAARKFVCTEKIDKPGLQRLALNTNMNNALDDQNQRLLMV